MIQDTRWRDCCQQNGEKKKTFWVMIDIPASFYYSCDVRPDTLMPETVASHFGWCSNLVICVALPANHLAGRSIINLSVNHSSHSQWCRMSVRGSEADMRWLYVQLWHFTPCSLAFWWVLCWQGPGIPATDFCALWRRSECAECGRNVSAGVSDTFQVKVLSISSAIVSRNSTELP